MALRLPRLQASQPITLAGGKPSTAFAIWWQNVAVAVEGAVNGIVDILVRLGLVEVDASGALALAESAINPGGTIKDDKVLTESVIANGITVPWFVSSSTLITFAPATDTDIFSLDITKALDETDLEIETQIELYGLDAIDIDIFCEVIQGGSPVGAKDYRLKIDGNNDTNLPFLYKFIISAVDAGACTVRIYGTRFSANACETSGDYFMSVKEFKR